MRVVEGEGGLTPAPLVTGDVAGSDEVMSLGAGVGPAIGAPEDSLRRRYAFKLASNFVGLPLSLAVQTLIPRALGPTAYGGYSFLASFFTESVNAIETGSSLAFFNKLCA